MSKFLTSMGFNILFFKSPTKLSLHHMVLICSQQYFFFFFIFKPIQQEKWGFVDT